MSDALPRLTDANMTKNRFLTGAAVVVLFGAASLAPARAQTAPSQAASDAARLVPAATAAAVQTIPGMPPVINASNIYSEARPGNLNPEVAKDPARIYVPNLRSNDVYVIDPATMKVVDRFPVGKSPQHVVPSWDLRTLWATNNAEGTTAGSLTPIDPRTGKPGAPIPVDDPYNMYFTPDGKSAIVVAEARKRLDFRDPHSMQMQGSVEAPECRGINHAGFSIDGRYAIFTCEFGGMLAKVDTVNRQLIGYLKLSKGGMPQDILTAPNARPSMWPTCMLMACSSSMATRSRKQASFRPALARTASTRAAMRSSCMWRTVAPTRCMVRVTARKAASPSSIS